MKDSRTRIDVRIAPELAQLLTEQATREHRSLNNLCAHILTQYVDGVMERHSVVRRERAGLPVRQATRRAMEAR